MVFALSCGDKEKPSRLFSIRIESPEKQIQQGDRIALEIKNNSEYTITDIRYTLNGTELAQEGDSLLLNPEKLGDLKLEAHITYQDKEVTVDKQVRVLAKDAPLIYDYEILGEFPHDATAFTQGLEFYRDTLYEGTGKNGKSVLRKLDFATGKKYGEVALDNAYFGEGITVLNDTVYQLTWQSGIGFMYRSHNLEKVGSFRYGKSAEGWGLCNDGNQLYKSDGSDKIWILNPKTLEEIDYLQIVTNTSVFNKANELEYVGGKIYANVWQKESMMIIDSRSGAIEGVVNFGGLRKMVRQHPDLDVLNGIAYHPGRQTFFVTGKFWNKLFEVAIKPREN